MKVEVEKKRISPKPEINHQKSLDKSIASSGDIKYTLQVHIQKLEVIIIIIVVVVYYL